VKLVHLVGFITKKPIKSTNTKARLYKRKALSKSENFYLFI